jgi:regulator of sigma E protease
MYILLAIVLLAVAAAVHAVAAIAARRGIDRLAGDVKPLPPALAVARGTAGVAAWYLAGSVVFTMGFLARGETVVDDTTMRVHVAPGGPAARAGVKDGDRVLKVAGEAITSWDQLKRVVAAHPDGPIAIDVDRAGEAVTLSATPEGSPPKILVGPFSEQKKMTLGNALGSALVAPGNVVVNSLKSWVRLFAGTEHAELSGPVGIVRETSKAAESQLATGILLAALLAAYVLPYVAIASALYEILARRRAKSA